MLRKKTFKCAICSQTYDKEHWSGWSTYDGNLLNVTSERVASRAERNFICTDCAEEKKLPRIPPSLRGEI